MVNYFYQPRSISVRAARNVLSNYQQFPTAQPLAYAITMRRPDRTELEAAFLAFLIVLPMGYWMLRTVLAFFGI